MCAAIPSRDPASFERIRALYDADFIAGLAHRLADELREHFATVTAGRGPVLNWTPPARCISEAGSWMDHPAFDWPHASAAPTSEICGDSFAQRVRAILAHGNNLHHPRYIGHQVPASLPLAALFDAVGSATNQVMAIYEMGPWATAVERAVLERVGQVLGFPAGRFAGLVTSGGSLANLTGLLTARNVALGQAWEQGIPASPSPVLLVHADVHYGITRSAGILGIGTRNVLRVPLDNQRRMDPRALDALLQQLQRAGRPVVAVCACACATPTGAFDPLEEVADLCERYGAWLHVDAAHGGAAAFSPRYRHLVAGLARADSIVVDAHKMMFMPALCAFVFYKNPAHRFEAFRQDAPYLFDPSAPGLADYDSGMLTIECTKRAAAYGVWGVWSLFGPGLFGDLVDLTFDRARELHGMLDAADDFEPLHDPQCNIVAFRYRPESMRQADAARLGEFNRRIRRELIESGRFYIVQTNLDGAGALRATVINPLTTSDDLRALLNAIRGLGRGQ